jgi:hypothetical protein
VSASSETRGLSAATPAAQLARQYQASSTFTEARSSAR